MAKSIETIISIFKENHGSKMQLLEDMADALCSATQCNGVNCNECPYNDGDSLHRSIEDLGPEINA